MTLLQKQQEFSRKLVLLLQKAFELGYNVTMGETWRPASIAANNAKKGIGIRNSLHCDRLAVDLNLFKGSHYLTNSESYRELGEYWESLSTIEYQCCWGGRFGDGNHFSIAHEGRK